MSQSENTLHGAFNIAAASFSKNIAVVDDAIHKSYRYQDLHQDVTRFSQFLTIGNNAKIISGTEGLLVGVLSEKGYNQVVSTLSIMQSGHAYLPLNVEWPLQRIIEVLCQGQVKRLLISQKMFSDPDCRESLSAHVELVVIEEILDNLKNNSQWMVEFESVTLPTVSAEDIAYVIFTSGSTGKPKGVTISHRGALNTINAVNERFQVNAHDVVLALAELSFDLSVYDIFGLLAVGGSIVFPDQSRTKDSGYWLSLINDYHITLWNTVPLQANLLVDECEHQKLPNHHIRLFLLSGDWIPIKLPDRLKKSFPNATVMSLGGATEGSIWSIWYHIEEVKDSWQSIPYGYAMSSQTMLVLTEQGDSCDVGEVGEIHIGGLGVALNYWGDEKRTAASFIHHPQFGRLYKTGDMGRLHEEGYIDFMGRIDNQVKIRGYRVELGEIEAALLTVDGIDQCVVTQVKFKNGNKQLVAYYLADQTLDVRAIDSTLESLLPDYMIPRCYIKLDAFPLTSNGKLDRSALPSPNQDDSHHELPSDEIESVMCQIWAEALNISVESVGIHDDFFRLGGDSIASIQISSKLRQRFGVYVNVKEFFNNRTISKISQGFIKGKQKIPSDIQSEQGLLSGQFGLLPIQQWFFNNNHRNKNHWNQSFVIKTQALESEKLQHCLNELFQMHDALRLRYLIQSDRIEQYYDVKAKPAKLESVDIRSLDLHHYLTNRQSEFDIEKGPLYSVTYLKGYDDQSARIVFSFHHLIIDTVSWRIIVEDLRQLYCEGKTAEKGTSYRQWVNAISEYPSHQPHQRQYWDLVMTDFDRTLVDRKRVNQSTQHVAVFELSQEETYQLLRETHQAYHTQINDILLVALGYSLQEITGSDINHIILEGHGREAIEECVDITKTVGWFTSMYPVRLSISESLSDSIITLKETLREIPDHGIGYGAFKGYVPKNIPAVCFNYLGQFDKNQQTDWVLVDEESGLSIAKENNECYAINITTRVIEGQFKFHLISMLDSKTTEKLSASYEKWLKKIIDRLVLQKRSYLTTSDIHHLLSQKTLDSLQKNAELEGVYLANSLQQGFIAHYLSQGDIDDAYHVQTLWEYQSSIQIDQLKSAWLMVQQKLSALRLGFNWDEKLIQVIHKSVNLDWRTMDISDLPSSEHDTIIQSTKQLDREQRFKLNIPGLFRIILIKQHDEKYTCIFSNHHAILDGWSLPILVNLVHDTYIDLINNKRPQFQFEDNYGDIQSYLQEHASEGEAVFNERLNDGAVGNHLECLLKKSEFTQQLNLATYKHVKSPKQIKVTLEQDLFENLKSVSREYGVALSSVMQYVWHKVLSVYSNDQTTIVGSTISGRNLPINHIENAIGLFINTLPLIVDHEKNNTMTLIDAIKLIQEDINEINSHSAANLVKIQKGALRLFDSLFVYNNFDSTITENYSGLLRLKFVEMLEKLDYPVVFTVEEGRHSTHIVSYYAEELFDRSVMDEALSLTVFLLEQISENPNKKVSELEYVNTKSVNKILAVNAVQDKELSKNTIAECFTEQVKLRGEDVALICDTHSISYQSLEIFTNQLAHYLMSLKIHENSSSIAFCLTKVNSSIIAMLGILKAGCAYVPINANDPDERILYILKEAHVSCLITDAENAPRLIKLAQDIQGLKTFILDNDFNNDYLVNEKTISPQLKSQPDDLAYIMYTSGTTGHPKGVMVTQNNVVSLVKETNYVNITHHDTLIQLADIAFDAATFEIWGALLNGAKLVIPSNGYDLLSDPEHLKSSLFTHQVSIAWFTKSLFDQFYLIDSDMFSRLNYLLIGGEALNLSLVKKILSAENRPKHIINGYGPTEGTTFSCTLDMTPDNLQYLNAVPIGKPLKNRTALVMDKNRSLLPIGAIGELYIGGEGVSKGYLNNKALTDEKFISNVFQTAEEKAMHFNERLYKTGDLVKWLPDGNLLYVGRTDNQIKIRGYRIELSEIESVLLGFSDIQQCAILLKESLGSQLVAYYVSPLKYHDEDIIQYLQTSLPSYMIPAAFCHLKEMPLTKNGKLDVKALPVFENTKHTMPVRPENLLEEKMLKLWSEVLGLDESSISVLENFFTLGGDSILCIQLVSKLKQEYQCQVTVKEIFSCKSIRSLCERIVSNQTQKKEEKNLVEEGILSGEVPLLPIQQWFFDRQFKKSAHWNQAFLIKTPPLLIERLEACFEMLVKHHDALRLSFSDTHQLYNDSVKPIHVHNLDVRDLSLEDIEETLTKWQSDFSLDGPLYRFGVLHGFEGGYAKIFMAFHHLIIDSVSWRILIEDLFRLYHGQSLPPKATSYRQWSQAIKRYADNHSSERDYWNEQIASMDNTPIIDHVKDTVTQQETTFTLSVDDTTKLLRKCHDAYHTQINDLLLAAVSYALSDVTKSNTHHILLEGHGREDIETGLDISRTVGWFTSLFPVKLERYDDLRQTIIETKETLRNVPQHGVGFGALLGYAADTLPVVSFNYLGQLNQEAKAKDSVWSLCQVNPGCVVHPDNAEVMLVSINSWTSEGKLAFNVKSYLSLESHTKIQAAFLSSIQDIIQHCEQKRFAEYTPHDFSEVFSEADLEKLPLVINDNESDWFEMTEIQKAYLLGRLGSYEIGNIANHIYHEYYYQALDLNKLQAVINECIKKFPVLRTVYSFENMQQRFLSKEEVPLFQVSLNDFSEREVNDTDLNLIRDRLSHKQYDPTAFPLFSVEISQFKQSAVLHISIDLILLDAQSRQMLFEIIDRLYRGNGNEIVTTPLNFKHYQEYASHLKHSKWYQEDKSYWLRKIPNMPLRPNLVFSKNPEDIQNPRFVDHTMFIDSKTWKNFKNKAMAHNVSCSSVLLALYGTVIAYFSENKAFLITMTLFNRYAFHKDVNSLMGDFTSTNLFHFESFGKNILQTIQRTHDEMWKDINHALFTGIEVQREFTKFNRLKNASAVSPIVFTGVIGNAYKDTTSQGFLEDQEILDKRYWSGQTSQAWIDLQAIETGDQFMSKWLYVHDLFQPEYIATLNTLYCQLISYLAEHDWDAPASLFTLPENDKLIIESANQWSQPIPEESLHDRLMKAVKTMRLKNQIAVIDSGKNLSVNYLQLSEGCDLLSRYLCHLNIQPQLIGVLSEKGVNQVFATVSIMQSGHAYLPLHVEWPVARLVDVLTQGGCDTVLISEAQYQQPEIQRQLSGRFQLIVIEKALSELKQNQPLKHEVMNMTLPTVKADDVAYVIFTSGSTGKPKGVTISHRGALNTIDAVNHRFEMTSNDRVLALSELSFDLSVYDIFGLLSVGGTIVFPAQAKTKDPNHWMELIQAHHITVWNTVPQLLGVLVDECEHEYQQCDALRVFLMSGDWIPVSLPERLKKICPTARVMSLGGATEGSIWSIWYEITEVSSNWKSIPYGVAMPNQKMLILNQDDEQCPIGVIGEIHIGGLGVALNYWSDEERTAKSYFEHPKLGRLYRTGDLGKWNPLGYIEFIGRKDSQVKIRGYRVELGEIENQILNHSSVKQSVVSAYKNTANQNNLIAYIVADNHQSDVHIQAKFQKKKNDDLEFKLRQLGNRVLSGDEKSIDLGPIVAETETVFARKSYRQFNRQNVTQEEFCHWLESTFSVRQSSKKIGVLDGVSLGELLSPLQAYSHQSSPLPKFRYPSPGSSYFVQTYIQIGDEFSKTIPKGYYYYDRTSNILRLISECVDNETDTKVYFVAKYSALPADYRDHQTSLALLEAGYMQGCLVNKAVEQGVEWQLIDETLSSIESKLNLEEQCQVIAGLKLNSLDTIKSRLSEITLYIKENGVKGLDAGWYIYDIQKLQLEHVLTTPFPENQFSRHNNRIYRDAGFVIVLSGRHQENRNIETLRAGKTAQQLMESANSSHLGLCAIGEIGMTISQISADINRDNDIIHLLIGGGVDEIQQKSQTTSHPRPDEALEDTIKIKLKSTLPEYMVPSDIIILDKIPLTANGKVDYRSLPKPESLNDQKRQKFIAPQSASERRLCGILSKVLGIRLDEISMSQDFFHLGGNSLLAMQFVSRINKEFSGSFKLKDLYGNSSIQAFSTLIEHSHNEIHVREEGVI